jgi:DNA polymerase (family 10)
VRKPDRLTLLVAHATASELIEYLRRSEAFLRIEACGEYRRRKDVPASVDIIAAVTDERRAHEHFLSWRHIVEDCGFSDGVCHAVTDAGAPVNLRFVGSETFGGSLFRYTGNDAFVSMFEGHEFAAEETDIFEAAGLPFIPPELREGRDEIEFVRSPLYQSLIGISDIRCDLHVHSSYSDGQNSVPLLAERAKKMGYAYVGIADHSMSLDAAKGISPKKFFEKRAAIDKLNRETNGFTVLCGTEVDIMPDGRLDYPDEVLDAADYVIGSVHIETKMDAVLMTPRIIKAIESGRIDVLGHPTGRIFGVRESLSLDFDAIARACAAHGVALEISGYPNRFDLNDENILRAKAYGAVFSTNTDAHFIDHLDNMAFAVWNARRALLTIDDVINTRSLVSFKQWIKDRRMRYGKK